MCRLYFDWAIIQSLALLLESTTIKGIGLTYDTPKPPPSRIGASSTHEAAASSRHVGMWANIYEWTLSQEVHDFSNGHTGATRAEALRGLCKISIQLHVPAT